MCAHGVNRRLANGFRGWRRRPASGNGSAQICRSRTLCEYAEPARTRAQIICARTSSRRAVALSTERRIWRRWPACASPTDRRLGVASTETKPPQNVRPHPSRSAWNRWTHGRRAAGRSAMGLVRRLRNCGSESRGVPQRCPLVTHPNAAGMGLEPEVEREVRRLAARDTRCARSAGCSAAHATL
jgi:hypothetical protein